MGISSGALLWGLVRYANIGILLSSALVKKQIYETQNGRSQVTPADGDRLQLFFVCDATETLLEISTLRGTLKGIWDLYVNGILDSSGYDDYGAISLPLHREITLNQPIVARVNTIELRVNGRNALSTNYYLEVFGASVQ